MTDKTETCDKCGDTLAKSFYGGLGGITLSHSKSFAEWRLCSACKDDFLTWIGGDT